MLTAKDAKEDVIDGLNSGADDIIDWRLRAAAEQVTASTRPSAATQL
jgi:DNA-binding response OmpR family regulator